MATSITGQGIIAYKAPDDALSLESKNAVQNKVVNKEVNDLQKMINEKASTIINKISGDIATFVDGADDMPIKHLIANIEAVQGGSNDPSPENIRPITGWTGLTGARTGKNLVDISQFATIYSERCTYTNGVVSFMSLGSKMYTTGIPTRVPSGATLSWQITVGTAQNFRVRFGYADGTTQNIPVATTTFVAPKEITSIRIDYDASGTATLSNFMASIEPSDYVPYQGQTISVSWATEAGTVYGGTLDVITGELTVDKAYRVLNNPNKWATSSGTTAYQYVEDFSDRELYSDSYTGVICSYAPVSASGTLYARWRGTTSYRFGLVGESLDLATIQADASAGKIAICYNLATPQTYQLDLVTVETLYGGNTVYVDCGSVSVDYPADTKLYIDGLTIPDEDMIADGLIASGKYFTVNNQLYLSTAQIAAGAQIIPGSNCTATSITEALNALNT